MFFFFFCIKKRLERQKKRKQKAQTALCRVDKRSDTELGRAQRGGHHVLLQALLQAVRRRGQGEHVSRAAGVRVVLRRALRRRRAAASVVGQRQLQRWRGGEDTTS